MFDRSQINYLPDFVTVYYSSGFTEIALEFWRQISKCGGGALLIRRKF